VDTFVVRIWVPGEILAEGDTHLRGFVAHVASGVESPFAGPEELVALLRAWIAGEGRSAMVNGRELTRQERRVAELAGSGGTNADVARELGLSIKTVEAHLARVFRKLGIRSRAELRARLEGDRPLGRSTRPAEPSGRLKSTSARANDPAEEGFPS
jgi:DNA-binding CsgD family transcriptional regulator